jgi:hypothetical protein
VRVTLGSFFRSSFWSTVWGGVAFALAAAALQISGVGLGRVFSTGVEFEPSEDGYVWTARLDSLPPGLYYLSAGHHARPCEIRAGGERALATTQLDGFPLRTGLFLGAPLDLRDLARRPASVSVACRKFHIGDGARVSPFNSQYRASAFSEIPKPP